MSEHVTTITTGPDVSTTTTVHQLEQEAKG